MRRRGAYLAIALAAVGAVACGKKGPPLPPLRPVPGAVADLAADRLDDQITLRFTAPSANADGTTPVALDRIEIYALTLAAGDPAPTRAALLAPGNLLAAIPVRPAGGGVSPSGSGAGRPAPGERATYVDRLAAGAAAASDQLRYYAAVSAVGRRPGPVSSIVPVPFGEAPPAPAAVKVDYDEKIFTVSWASDPGPQRFLVYDASPASAEAALLSTEPLADPRFTGAVEFGRERCFVVRGVRVTGRVFVRGEASAPVCVTFSDRFAPPAPTGLLAVAGDGGVDLVWSAVEVSDLAGYLVLRGEGPNGTLQRLTADPITATRYRDTTVTSGATYVYSVVALDASTPPNLSAQSSRQVVTAR